MKLALCTVFLLVSLPLFAGDIRVGGSPVGRVESNGDVRIHGSVEGRFEANGDIRVKGSVQGRIESGGTIRQG